MADKGDVIRRKGTAVRVMNTEIKKEIVKQKAVDTGRMRNVSVIKDLALDFASASFTLRVDSTKYYVYVDEGLSRKYFDRKKRRDITKAFMRRDKVVEQMEKLSTVMFENLIDEQFR